MGKGNGMITTIKKPGLAEAVIGIPALLFILASCVMAADGAPYIWPQYNPSITYNFRDEYPDLAMPTRDIDDCKGVVGSQSDGWWTVKWGANLNSLVTSAAITSMLARLNRDFAYFRDTMGWPPDKRVQDGYRSAVYLYGSGLCTDNASNTEKGGWQSGVGKYPIILASYYPVYSFDPACKYTDRETQMGGMVHEGIHCILASLPGAKKAAWFQEGGNTWLQQQAAAQQTNDYRAMGFLNATQLIAPFMPIECYSGWLQDGSFGGPSAEGVDKFDGSQQICTWRRLLGGNQYGNLFPTFLGEWLGLGSVPWIWRNCPGRVLEGMAAKLGDEQIRRLITEYRAKLALLDMKQWSGACRQLINDNFGSLIGPEWEPYWINCDVWKATPYAKTTVGDGGVLVPEQRTLPGWSGANQIPLTVSGTMVTVDFQPIGANMSCQLCYRSKDGIPVYSVPVKEGTCSLRLDKTPSKGVVIAVICNTDYKYLGEETRKAHFDYRIKPVDGVSGTADINTKWYEVSLSTAVNGSVVQSTDAGYAAVVHPEIVGNGSGAVVTYDLGSAGSVSIGIYSSGGRLIARLPETYRNSGHHRESLSIPHMLPPGLYLVRTGIAGTVFTCGVVITR